MSSVPDTLSRSVAGVWRTLRSMRMALALLLVVGAASVAGSLVPQASVSPDRVADLFRAHPLVARVYAALGLFDVYGSWWFTLAYVLLLVSLASCVVPRTRALMRSFRERPRPTRDLGGFRHYARGSVAGSPDEAVARARRVLRRRRYRVAGPGQAGTAIAAEKGLAREVGSLLFHGAFFLLLVGVIYGKGAGFTGSATVVEGETWTEALASYDVPPREGRFFGDHRGFRIRVLDFDARYRPNGVPEDFVSRVELLDTGVRRETTIRVNHPLVYRGVKIYQAGYGWAPVIRVRRGHEVLWDGPVVFVTDRPGDRFRPWRGVIKLPSLRPQVGLELRLLPDPASFVLGRPMLEARNPFLGIEMWRGDLGLTAAQNVFTLDKRRLTPVPIPERDTGMGTGGTVRLPGDVEVSFPALREYTQLQVASDPGRGLVLAAAVLILLGLLPALFSSRRKLWVRAQAEDGGAVLEVAGFALQRQQAFEEEFADLAERLAVRPAAGGPEGRVRAAP